MTLYTTVFGSTRVVNLVTFFSTVTGVVEVVPTTPTSVFTSCVTCVRAGLRACARVHESSVLRAHACVRACARARACAELGTFVLNETMSFASA